MKVLRQFSPTQMYRIQQHVNFYEEHKCVNLIIFVTVNMLNKCCRRLDSNLGPLESEATALPTEPPLVPNLIIFFAPQAIYFHFNYGSTNMCSTNLLKHFYNR